MNNQTNEGVAIKKVTNVFSKKILAKRALREIKLLQHFRGHRNVSKQPRHPPPPSGASTNPAIVTGRPRERLVDPARGRRGIGSGYADIEPCSGRIRSLVSTTWTFPGPTTSMKHTYTRVSAAPSAVVSSRAYA